MWPEIKYHGNGFSRDRLPVSRGRVIRQWNHTDFDPAKHYWKFVYNLHSDSLQMTGGNQCFSAHISS